MIIALRPKAALGPIPLAVGVFSFVFVVLVLNRSAPDKGEPDRECDTHQIYSLKSKNLTVRLAAGPCPFGARHSSPFTQLPKAHVSSYTKAIEMA